MAAVMIKGPVCGMSVDEDSAAASFDYRGSKASITFARHRLEPGWMVLYVTLVLGTLAFPLRLTGMDWLASILASLALVCLAAAACALCTASTSG